jgi:hypothetical protein
MHGHMNANILFNLLNNNKNKGNQIFFLAHSQQMLLTLRVAAVSMCRLEG